MKLSWTVPFLLAGSACVTTELGTHESEITGGSPESGYPSVFALAYQGQGGCTGTCITPKIGLTAQHCVTTDPASSFTALFGATETAPTKTIQVTAVANEPGGADIALVAFAEACPGTTPYNQTALEQHTGEPVVMVGFGVTTETADDAGIKRSGTATLFSVTPSQVAGMKAGELATSNAPHGTCNGDSGGPTFMTFGGVQYMVGVTSRGSLKTATMEYPCGQGRSIAVRADTYKTFINGFIAQHDPSFDPDDPPPGGGGGDTPPGGEVPGGGEGEGEGDESATVGGCQTAGGSTGFAPLLALGLFVVLRRRRQAHG